MPATPAKNVLPDRPPCSFLGNDYQADNIDHPRSYQLAGKQRRELPPFIHEFTITPVLMTNLIHSTGTGDKKTCEPLRQDCCYRTKGQTGAFWTPSDELPRQRGVGAGSSCASRSTARCAARGLPYILPSKANIPGSESEEAESTSVPDDDLSSKVRRLNNKGVVHSNPRHHLLLHAEFVPAVGMFDAEASQLLAEPGQLRQQRGEKCGEVETSQIAVKVGHWEEPPVVAPGNPRWPLSRLQHDVPGGLD